MWLHYWQGERLFSPHLLQDLHWEPPNSVLNGKLGWGGGYFPWGKQSGLKVGYFYLLLML